MCRNIKTLFNFEPTATETEIRAASIQFVRKLSGSTRPSKTNEPAFELAIEDISAAVSVLLNSMVTYAEPGDREVEATKTRVRAVSRFATLAPDNRV